MVTIANAELISWLRLSDWAEFLSNIPEFGSSVCRKVRYDIGLPLDSSSGMPSVHESDGRESAPESAQKLVHNNISRAEVGRL